MYITSLSEDGCEYYLTVSFSSTQTVLYILKLPRGPQQAEILDTDAEIRAEILLKIRDPKSQAIFFRLFP